MNTALFHADAGAFFDHDGLRAFAADIVRTNPLMQRAAAGDRVAAQALHNRFWPFVREFEMAIDQQALPREPLVAKYGAAGGVDVRRTIVGLARAVREMKEDEGSHAMHWAKDAQHLGLPTFDDAPTLPGVQALIDASYTRDLPTFFAVLAGTEYIAEEMSRLLVGAPAFTALFDRGRWVWGEIHLTPHDDGPSHLEIDLDLARAYCADDAEAKPRVEALVRETIAGFDRAAREIERQPEAQRVTVAA